PTRRRWRPPWPRRRRPNARLKVLREPAEHFLHVSPAVLPFQDPVALVREDDQPGRNLQPLQDLESGQALVDRDPIIEFALRDQGRRMERARIADRALLVPLPALFPDRTAHAQLAVEASIIDAVLRFVVDRAGMIDDAFELLRMAVEPVH